MDYDMSDSDDGFDDEGKMLLDNFSSKSKSKINEKNTVLDFDENDDDDDDAISEDGDENIDEKSDIDMGSDIEQQQDYMPDDRAWGQKRKNYYNADFVDKDYFGAYNAEEAEAAELEEQEAKNIQKRLMEQIEDADFFTDFKSATTDADVAEQEVIATDVSKLSKSEKLRFLRKTIPEFNNLIEDYEAKATEATEKILPVLALIKEGKLPKSSAGDFLRIKYRIILNYLVNISYYILLKLKMTPAKNHPVLQALLRYRQILTQMQPIHDEIIAPQVAKILETLAQPEDVSAVNIKTKERKQKKKMLKLLQKVAPKPESEEELDAESEKMESSDEGADSEAELETSAAADSETPKSEKRAITYQMAKNKGLTPKRSKEQRNPRVKHRNKFRKANIRRRGQVRTPRSEIPVYGGEPTGIKIGLKKGRKIM